MKRDTATVSPRLSHLAELRPQDRSQLRTLVRRLWGIDVVAAVRGPGASAPLDYLAHAFFEPAPSSEVSPACACGALDAASAAAPTSGGGSGGDCVVWANRGGGKTLLGAVATLLDLIYKPGVQVRILGGSLEQATKMHEHLVRLLEADTMRGILAAPSTARRVVLRNRSRAEILAGSQRSVRGVRVHKLRCDEVEELDPAVWAAAQLTTRSGWCGDFWVRGAVEALSTMHRPAGLMAVLVNQERHDSPLSAAAPPRVSAHPLHVFRWDAMDVAARCPPALPCKGCALWDDCRGRAKHATGFVPIADLIQQRKRTSDATWAAEMMCRRPGVQHAVFPAFDPDRHVVATPSDRRSRRLAASGPVAAGPRLSGASPDARFVAGMDFGLRNPTVVLWARVWGRCAGDANPIDAPIFVVAEYDATNRTLDQNLLGMERTRERFGLPAPPDLGWLAIDPAGHARNAHSGRSDAAVLREAGYRVRSCAARIEPGVEAIRRRLDRGTLSIHPRCTKLIAALQGYHFDPRRPESQVPVKDGPDHWCDALRYLVTTLERPADVRHRSYLERPAVSAGRVD